MVAVYDQLGPAGRKLRNAIRKPFQEDPLPLYETPTYAEVAGWSEPQISYALAQEKKQAASKPVVQSRIRVWLSRPLTWAEKEAVETNHDDVHGRRINDSGLDYKFRVSSDKEYIWVDASFGSRISFDLVAALLEQHLVNVYPKAVRTFREYNGE